MASGWRALRRQCRSLGESLAWIALVVQILQPFFVADAIVLLTKRAETVPGAYLCLVPGSRPAPAQHNGAGHQPHGLADGCPLCAALAAAQALAEPAAIALALPELVLRIVLSEPPAAAPARVALPAYRSRAPPLNL